MKKDNWRFDPNKDYCDDYEEERGMFRPFKKNKKFKKDKFDGKRRSKNQNDDDWNNK